ncbi:MAG: sulfatase [Candidatus Sumerlaeota bacterium]|nr:sulfatase [Candidatus Sumerlaeota bacterium]
MPQRRPNILYIMSDDHAANAVSAYGSILARVFETPNIDRIGAEGVRLNNFFSTNAICTPARANILSGQYGHVNGVRTLNDVWTPGYRPNLAVSFQEAGYQNAIFGKWHLHRRPEGFDEYKYLYNSGEQGTYRNPEFNEKDRGVVQYKSYVTDIITDMALDFLRRRDRARPFFVMCHHKAPHDYWDYHERHAHLFDGIDIPEPVSLFEDRSHRSIASRDYGGSVTPRNKTRSLYVDFCRPHYVTGPLVGTETMTFEARGRAAYQKYLKDYLRVVAGIDDSVAALLKELEGQGLLDDTLVIYTSDQGMYLGEHDYQDKRWSYEEGLRSPFLVRYPKEIAAGAVRDDLMANVDIAPTLLDYAGVDTPEAMQGFSCRGMLAGDPAAGRRQEVYFRYWMHFAHRLENPAHYGIRTDRWKLIFYYGLPLDARGAIDEPTPAGWELYDMKNDPLELHNLYEDPICAEVREQLKARLVAVKQKIGDTDERYPDLLERV